MNAMFLDDSASLVDEPVQYPWMQLKTECRNKRRVYKEFKEVERLYPQFVMNDNGLIYAGLFPEDLDMLDVYNVSVVGPQGSPYEGGVFKVKIEIPHDYPMQSPTIRFVTPIMHPRIDNNGMIDSEKGQLLDWTPAFNIISIVLCLSGLFLSSPLDYVGCWKNDAEMEQQNELCSHHPEKWKAEAVAHTKKHASPLPLRTECIKDPHVLFLLWVGKQLLLQHKTLDYAFMEIWSDVIMKENLSEMRILDTVLAQIGTTEKSDTVGIDVKRSAMIREKQRQSLQRQALQRQGSASQR